MSDRDESERSQAGRNWLSTLNESRSNCREAVADAMVEVPDPNLVLWPTNRPRGNTQHEAAIRAHVSVLDFADHLQPYRDEGNVDGLWTETLDTVELTEEDTLEITLDNLDEWEFKFFTNTVSKTDELHGEQQQKKQYRVLLPVSGMRACYNQLNHVTIELGFGAEANADGLPSGRLKTPAPE